MRVRRTKAEIEAGVTLEQARASRGTDTAGAFIERLRASNYDGGYCPSVFAAMAIEYLTGRRDKDEFETSHPEIFR